MKYYLGCDPDLTKTAMVIVEETGTPVFVEIVSGKGKGRDAILSTVEALEVFNVPLPIAAAAVEAQEIYTTGKYRTKNPRSIMLLATVAGACLCRIQFETYKLYFPAPQAWKGTKPKQIHQARIYKRIGWEYEKVGKDPKKGYCRPIGVSWDGIRKGDWKHIGDALGLALWVKDQEELND